MRPRIASLLCALLLFAPLVPTPAQAAPVDLGEPVIMRAAAVAETATGFVGSTATITITAARNGSGHVFLDTFPLTEVDMQGSARLAARVASQLSGLDLHAHDFFFVIRSGAEQIGGPSAGATMTVGAIAALNGWSVRNDVLMTGTIQPDGSVGPVGGIPEKAQAAAQAGMRTFLFPAGAENAALSSAPDQPLHLPAYCRDQLGIECVPVLDVLDAIGIMTDHVIERPRLDGDVTGEQFRARLGPMAAELVDDADTLLAEANASLAAAPDTPARAGLLQRLAAADATLARARDAVANGTAYTASSLSFQASIEGHYLRDAGAMLVAADPGAKAQELIRAAAQGVADATSLVDAAKVERSGQFEAVAAAQVRVMEAETHLATARSLAANATTFPQLLDATYWAAYGSERAGTATWWLRLGEGQAQGDVVTAEGLAGFARDTITTSTEEVAYVEAVFGAGLGGAALRESRLALESADVAMARGYVPAAMLHALEASVRASVLLELGSYPGGVPATKVDAKRDAAAIAIQQARARGIEPFLAQSEYEFGLSLEDVGERMVFLGLARVTANLAGLPGLFGDAQPAPSRFQGFAEPPGVPPLWVVAFFAVGLAMGVGLGVFAILPKKPERAVVVEDVPLLPPPPADLPFGPPRDG